MTLPVDYDNPEGEALAELECRTAIRDLFLTVAGDYGFDEDHAHLLPRYPDTDEEWAEIATIRDPDTEDDLDSEPRRLTRYFTVVFAGYSRVLTELTLRYDVQLSIGFKDSYVTEPTRRSYDELTALSIKFGKVLADNQELGLDDRVSHTFLQAPLRPRWTPEDDQGNSTVTLDMTLGVVLQVCKM